MSDLTKFVSRLQETLTQTVTPPVTTGTWVPEPEMTRAMDQAAEWAKVYQNLVKLTPDAPHK